MHSHVKLFIVHLIVYHEKKIKLTQFSIESLLMFKIQQLLKMSKYIKFTDLHGFEFSECQNNSIDLSNM